MDAISFDVMKGEVLGFLGPNGAGKSTTMKMLTCFITPTAGRAEVAGFDVFQQSLEVRRRIGYLPEDTPLYRDMTVLEYLDYVTELRRVPHSERRGRIKRIGEVTGIMQVLGKKIGELSFGYRQRVGLTQAMVHDPEILILMTKSDQRFGSQPDRRDPQAHQAARPRKDRHPVDAYPSRKCRRPATA